MPSRTDHVLSDGRWSTPVEALRIVTEIVECKKCQDNGACSNHEAAKVSCRGCGATGQFITGMVNGVLVGPGGIHFRCGGKGYHTKTDRTRNNYYDTHQIVRL